MVWLFSHAFSPKYFRVGLSIGITYWELPLVSLGLWLLAMHQLLKVEAITAVELASPGQLLDFQWSFAVLLFKAVSLSLRKWFWQEMRFHHKGWLDWKVCLALSLFLFGWWSFLISHVLHHQCAVLFPELKIQSQLQCKFSATLYWCFGVPSQFYQLCCLTWMVWFWQNVSVLCLELSGMPQEPF